jgi:hypothetical protein
MSLINDALRRASQNTKREPNEIPNMQPTLRQQNKSGGPGMMIILICFVLAGGATLGIWAYWNKKYKNPKAAQPAASTNAPASAKLTTNNNPIARAADTLTKVQTANKEGEAEAAAIQAPVAKPAPAPTPAAVKPASAPAGTAANPRVQAIFYSQKDPTAMINGKTVRSGETVDGMVILQIKPKSVQVQTAGGIKELTVK